MRFQRITLVTIIVLLISVIAIGIVMAQENIETEDVGFGEVQEISDPALKLGMSVEGQEYPNKKIEIVLTIDSLIDSDRVGVEWTYPLGLFFLQGDSRDVLKVREGQQTVFRKALIPRENFSSDKNQRVEFGTRVNAFVANVNYLSATTTVAEFNGDLELLPINSDYQTAKTVDSILKWAILIVILLAIIAVIVYLVRRFRAYLNEPDPET